ncbi:phosphopantetheine-binding protein, partial [Streptomyces sp. NPDC047028]|uniref:phosphopantetheine-binding protein n=1 Tax=Streptomyces sp. NPDC047028 TaxID=3155793 RepID=UPI0033CB80C5
TVSYDDLSRPSYWVRHVREAVRFADAVTTLDGQGVGTFLELGPDAALTPMVADPRAVPTLRRDRTEPQALTEALTRLPSVDWTAYFGPGRNPVDLPTYAFQHQHYWLASAGRAAGGAGAPHMTAPEPEPDDTEDLLSALRAADEAGRAELLGGLVRDATAGVLGHTGADEAIEPDSDFMDLGFTSLLAVEFRDRLTAALGGLKLPAAVIYEYGTPEELVEYLAEELEDTLAD